MGIDWQDMGLVTICLVSLAFSAFFSGCETGYMSLSRVRLRNADPRMASRVRALVDQMRNIEDPILTCLIGTNLFNVAFSAVITVVLTARYGTNGQWLAVLVVSTVVILFGEILPKVVYREFPERMTLGSVPAVTMAMKVSTPVRWALKGYTALWDRFLPRKQGGAEQLDRLNLAALLLTNVVPVRDDQRFVHAMNRYLALASHRLSESMRPLDQLVTITPDATVGACLGLAAESGYSRLPVADARSGGLPAYVLVRDLLFLPREDHGIAVPRRLWRSLLLVDERMTPYELFEELRSQGRQLAVVVDMAGNPRGLITLEDLIETVVGSIHDEFDAVPSNRGSVAITKWKKEESDGRQ